MIFTYAYIFFFYEVINYIILEEDGGGYGDKSAEHGNDNDDVWHYDCFFMNIIPIGIFLIGHKTTFDGGLL